MNVLDHGYVNLLGYLGTDETVVSAARQSTSGGFVSWEPYVGHPRGDQGLLSYLYRNQHMTPFEMCELTLAVQAPIFVIREWQRHRSFSYNEASARYAVMPDIHYVPALDRMRTQATANRQGSAEPLEHDLAIHVQNDMVEDQSETYEHYTDYLDAGLSREIARINTPVSRYSRMWVKGNLRNWLHFLELRTHASAQYEIRVYADVISTLISELWPRTHALYVEHTRDAVRLTRAEHQALVDGRASPCYL